MIKFIHTADIHYGMENYGKIDPKTGIHTRLLDFDRAFNAVVDKAINEDVDFFLFCGDAYKTANPSPTQQRLLFKALLRLLHAKIPIVLIVGNHDNPLTFGKAHALEIFGELPLNGFYIISKPTTIRLETKNGPINIIGIPWPTRNSISLNKEHNYKSAHELTTYISQVVNRIINHHAENLNPSEPAILAGHLTVSSGIFSGSEKRAIFGSDPVFLPSQLAIPPFDYVALGHLHRHQNLNKNGIPVVYSGSTERIDFGERKEDKGFCLVKIPEKGKANYEFYKTPMRSFIQIEVHISQGDNQTEKVINEIKKHTLKDAVIKIIYHIPAEMHDEVDTQAIQKACVDAHFLVSVIPIKTHITRQPRKQLNIGMNMETLLEKYFETKPELNNQKEELIKQAMKFAQQFDTSENEKVER